MAWITPVTDRTLEDVLDAKNNQAGTLGKKGAMDYPDLNRIEDNYKYLMGLLNGAGYYNQFESRNVTETWKEPVKLPPDEHTLLLLHGEDFLDSSLYSVPITNNGVQISSVQSKFGGKSFYFEGSSNILLPNSFFNITDDTFSIDFWLFSTNNLSDRFILSGVETGSFFIGLQQNNFIGIGRTGIAWDLISSEQLQNNQWSHVAFSYQNGYARLFLNGSIIAEATINQNYNMLSGDVNIGSQGNNYYIYGYVDEIRVSNIARWTSNFTPPTSPYTVDGGTEVVEKSQTFTDWQKDNIFFKPEADRIRRNLNKLSQIYLKGLGLPELDFLDSLNYIEANQWEDIELETYNAYSRMVDGYKYCGTQISGGVTL